jgi:hypothetical protein
VNAPRSMSRPVSVLVLASATALVALVPSGAIPSQEKRPPAAEQSGTGLSTWTRILLRGNRVECLVDNTGRACFTDFRGGTWPAGSLNRYVYNSGLQVAGLFSPEAGPWAGDTVGAYFVDPRGTQPSGDALTPGYVSTDPDDLAQWPAEARIPGGGVYALSLAGRAAISDQDSWVRYWDGNPRPRPGRQHPVGIEVTQRTHAWNWPSGNADVLYYVFEVRNVTHEAVFQLPNELEYFAGEDGLPDGGWPIEQLYVAFTTDFDVAAAHENFSTAILPFDLGLSYHGRFEAPGFTYPPEIFHAPFFGNAPGLVGVVFVPGSGDAFDGAGPGLTLFSVTSVGFSDPVGDRQLWRYLSGRLDPASGDNPCSVAPEVDTGDPATTERSICYLSEVLRDTRFYQSTGPLRLEPGETATLVVALVLAATVETMPDGSPSGIVPGVVNQPGVPSFHPEFASARGCDPSGQACTDTKTAAENAVRPIERAAGWVSYAGPAPTGRAGGALEGPENKLAPLDVAHRSSFELVPRSLLWKAQLAREVVRSGFAVTSLTRPEPPPFYLVPGDRKVTVVWEPSPTEEAGDPLWPLASEPSSAFYNPNYRRDDVQLYRVWRRTAGREEFEPLAEFVVPGRPFLDHSCETVRPEEDVGTRRVLASGDTVEVTGFAVGEICPLGSEPLVRDPTPSFSDGRQYVEEQPFMFNTGGPGNPPGGGVTRTEGSLRADAIRVDTTWARPPLEPMRPGSRQVGVPFAYTDAEGIYNNFVYEYAVTAVDLNSAYSGPIAQESELRPQAVIPRSDAGNLEVVGVETYLAGDDGAALDPTAPPPSIDPDDGTFDGPFPPTDGLELSFARLVPRLLGAFEVAVRIDSFKPDTPAREACVGGVFSLAGVCARIYLTVDGTPTEVPIEISNWILFGRPPSTRAELAGVEVAYDPETLADFGLPAGTAGRTVAIATQDESINFINWEGQQNRAHRIPRTIHGGMRWFSGTEESTPDPARFIRVGHLDEVDSVWVPIHHTQLDATGRTWPDCEGCLPNSDLVQSFGSFLAHLGRAADLRVTWQGGTIDVRDVTHSVAVPFSREYGSSWGFLNADGDGDGVVSWWDRFCVGVMKAEWERVEALGGEICPEPILLDNAPELTTIALNTETDPTTGATAAGFALYLNGEVHFFAGGSPPPDGTVWTLRAYSGTVVSDAGTYATDDPAGYAYRPIYDLGYATGKRPPIIPGLTLHWRSEGTRVVARADLRDVHTVPDPYLGGSRYDFSPQYRHITFVNLPPRATIRIFSLGGQLVQQLEHDDPTGGGRLAWNLRDRREVHVASGVYFFHVATPEGAERVGKFTIVMGKTYR